MHIFNLYINYYISKQSKDQQKYGLKFRDYLSETNRHGGSIRMCLQGTQPHMQCRLLAFIKHLHDPI